MIIYIYDIWFSLYCIASLASFRAPPMMHLRFWMSQPWSSDPFLLPLTVAFHLSFRGGQMQCLFSWSSFANSGEDVPGAGEQGKSMRSKVFCVLAVGFLSRIMLLPRCDSRRLQWSNMKIQMWGLLWTPRGIQGCRDACKIQWTFFFRDILVVLGVFAWTSQGHLNELVFGFRVKQLSLMRCGMQGVRLEFQVCPTVESISWRACDAVLWS